MAAGRKNMLICAKLQSLVAKCCKMRKNIAMQSLQSLYTFVLRAEIATTFGPKMVAISARNTKVGYTKFANFALLYFFAFCNISHAITKFCNFTNFSMLFLAVAIYLQLALPSFKISL